MRLRALLWWSGLLLALPVALPQALWVRRTALRLPPAAGVQQGLAGSEFAGEPLRLLLIGESTVAGVGVAGQGEALAGQLGTALAQRLRRPVAWRACGENGITAAQACQRLLPAALGEPADLALLVFGVNDSTALSSLVTWDRALRELNQALVARGCRVAFSGVPPMQHFTVLPWLLRRLLGARGAARCPSAAAQWRTGGQSSSAAGASGGRSFGAGRLSPISAGLSAMGAGVGGASQRVVRRNGACHRRTLITRLSLDSRISRR